MRKIGWIVLAALVLAQPAAADVQDKAQQACLNGVLKGSRKIGGAILKDSSACVRYGAAGAVPGGGTAEACLTADLKGKVAKAVSGVGASAAKACTTVPDFGYSDVPTATNAYRNDNQGLLVDAFGSNLDATLAAAHASDPAGACASLLPATWAKLEGAMHAAVEGCLKAGLKAGTITDAAGYEACLDQVAADPKGTIAKAAGAVQSKLAAKCPSGDLALLFPGLPSICTKYGHATDAAGLSGCSRDRLECRVCRMLNAAWGLDRDCDLFDDSVANASCPDCGNAVVDSGEGCDDGNLVSGDGCSAACVEEYCGDGAINDNGAEACDDGAANSNSTADACRTDCSLPSCGDGVTDTGEECDDGNADDSDGCTSLCTSCGNGLVGGTEQCDDGNNAAGDCCSPSCTYEAYGTSCTGPSATQCTAPGCNGTGTCSLLPANENVACDDGDVCTDASECQSGTCVTTSAVITGDACRWAVVGTATTGSGGARMLFLEQSASSTGDWCGDFARIGISTTLGGDLILQEGDSSTPGAELDTTAGVDSGDVVTNNARINGLAGVVLPGVAVTTIAPGSRVNKTPSPTFYDTTGTDPRLAQCAAAQAAFTATAASLDAMSATSSLGSSLTGVTTGSTHTVTATSPGSINVIDVDNITGGQDVVLNLSGGGNSSTVMVLRVANTLNTSINWQWNLTGGLTADHLLIYGKGSGLSKCEIGQDNVGGGTIFCPASRIKLVLRTQWTGALLGGGTSAYSIDVGENAVLTHQRFTGF